MTRHARHAAFGSLLLLAAMVVPLWWSPAAGAHAVLESTDPAAGSTVATSPRRIGLTFGESVTAPAGAIRLFDGTGRQIDTGRPSHPGGDGTRVAVSVPSLDHGTYVVAWKAISADSHPVNGAFTFSVGAASTDATGLVTQYADAGGSRAVGLLAGLVRVLGYGSTALLLGGGAFVAWCWSRGPESERSRSWLRWSAALGVAVSLASIPIQGAYGEGDGIGQVVDPSLWGEVMSSRFGAMAVVRAGAFAVGIWLASVLPRARTAWWRTLLVAVGAAVALSFALAGHGATGRWPVAGVALDVAHVAGFSVWIGGLVGLLAWALRDADLAAAVAAARRFSGVALVAVSTIVVSGGAQGLRQVGWSWVALSSTTYGRLLIAKVVLVLGVVGVAWLSRRHLRGPTPAPDRGGPAGDVDAATGGAAVAAPPRSDGRVRRSLRRTVGWETAGLAGVLVISAVLSVTIPAREAVELPFDRIVVSGGGSAQISVIPARAGTDQIHVTVSQRDGGIPDIAEMTVQLRLPERDLGPIDVPMTRLASNHFIAEAATIPFPGDWRLTAQARTGEFDEQTFEVTVPVR